MLNIILFGAPGTGKGTQSGLLIDRYRLIHFSTGDMLRKAIAENTPVGLEAKNYIDKGLLVPDDIIIRLAGEEIKKCSNCRGFVFDGFPRTISQAIALDEMLEEYKAPVSLVFYLEVNEKELIRRILNRASISGRTDDSEEVIRKRVEVYHEQTYPLLQYYEQQNKCITIDGMKSINLVFMDICENIDYYLSTLNK